MDTGSTGAGPPPDRAPPPAPLERRAAQRLEGGRLRPAEEAVAAEWPLTLFVDGSEWATLLVTPADLEEMVVGFLAAEGAVAGPGDIAWMAIDGARGEAWVSTKEGGGTRAAARFGRRALGSCCGKARLGLYWQEDAERLSPFPADRGPSVTADACLALMAGLERAARDSLFGQTGGVHAAALGRADGTLVSVRADIGRHNALDKLYGHSLLSAMDVSGMVIAFTGRLSSEVLLKVAKIGVAVVVAKSAPTGLALDLADRLGVTAVAFARGDRMTVHTGAHRIAAARGA